MSCICEGISHSRKDDASVSVEVLVMGSNEVERSVEPYGENEIWKKKEIKTVD